MKGERLLYCIELHLFVANMMCMCFMYIFCFHIRTKVMYFGPDVAEKCKMLMPLFYTILAVLGLLESLRYVGDCEDIQVLFVSYYYDIHDILMLGSQSLLGNPLLCGIRTAVRDATT